MFLASLVCLYCAIADRVRGGFPSSNVLESNEITQRLKTIVWFFSGFVLSAYLLSPQTWIEYGTCVVTSILFALGERQNMGVIGWIYPTSKKQFAGWIQQFRIGAVWAAIVAPTYFLNHELWVLIPACSFGPIIGAVAARFLTFKLRPDWLLELNGQWAWTEFYRGLSMASISVLLT